MSASEIMQPSGMRKLTMPPEWYPHDRCWIAWPCRLGTWGSFEAMGNAKRAFATIARTIARFEPVTMITRVQDRSEAKILCGGQVDIQSWPLSDSWLRDSGPLFVHRPGGQVVALNWRFNAWGYSYADFHADTAIASKIAHHLKVEHIPVPLVLEGSAVQTDGEGTLLASRYGLLNPNRNPHVSQGEVETLLARHLGVEQIVWLAGDWLDDPLATQLSRWVRYVRPGCVLIQQIDDPSQPGYQSLQETYEQLVACRDAQGRQLEITTLTAPPPILGANGRLRFCSYLDYYLANGAIIAPLFGAEERDNEALAALQRLFPERQIIGYPARDIAIGGQGIFAITQPQPQRGSELAQASGRG